MMPSTTEETWTVADVAAYLDVQPSTVRAYVARDQMPGPDGRLGATPWWRPETVQRWRPPPPYRPGQQLDRSGDVLTILSCNWLPNWSPSQRGWWVSATTADGTTVGWHHPEPLDKESAP